MPGTTIIDDQEISSSGGAGGRTSLPPPEGRGGGGGGNGRGGGDGQSQPAPRPGGVSRRVYYTGIWIALAGILMFFMSLVSAYIVRKSSVDWRAVILPRIVWLNTAVLLVSSLALEAAHRAWEREEAGAFRAWWAAATALGVLFLAGQWVAWRELAAAGVFLATNPSSSFFYLFTAAHGLHVAGGLAALGYVLSRGWLRLRASGGVAAEVAGIYWHFMDGLWVFLLLVLTLGR
ncbi:MAG TPA: cytochrome c oxidase subunit 3 [Candidatus Acidoferrales bacterium]|nr:cytochrome c oxidase subunit 3 [Candidatus Acidoferrales bacterium]